MGFGPIIVDMELAEFSLVVLQKTMIMLSHPGSILSYAFPISALFTFRFGGRRTARYLMPPAASGRRVPLGLRVGVESAHLARRLASSVYLILDFVAYLILDFVACL